MKQPKSMYGLTWMVKEKCTGCINKKYLCVLYKFTIFFYQNNNFIFVELNKVKTIIEVNFQRIILSSKYLFSIMKRYLFNKYIVLKSELQIIL